MKLFKNSCPSRTNDGVYLPTNSDIHCILRTHYITFTYFCILQCHKIKFGRQEKCRLIPNFFSTYREQVVFLLPYLPPLFRPKSRRIYVMWKGVGFTVALTVMDNKKYCACIGIRISFVENTRMPFNRWTYPCSLLFVVYQLIRTVFRRNLNEE